MAIKKDNYMVASELHHIYDKLDTLWNKVMSGTNVYLDKPHKNDFISRADDFLPIKNKLNILYNNEHIHSSSSLLPLEKNDEPYAQLFIDTENIINNMSNNYCSCHTYSCSCDANTCSCVTRTCDCHTKTTCICDGKYTCPSLISCPLHFNNCPSQTCSSQTCSSYIPSSDM